MQCLLRQRRQAGMTPALQGWNTSALVSSSEKTSKLNITFIVFFFFFIRHHYRDMIAMKRSTYTVRDV